MYVGRWSDYPIAVTAYGYMFGAAFMGLSIPLCFFTGQASSLSIPRQVQLAA